MSKVFLQLGIGIGEAAARFNTLCWTIASLSACCIHSLHRCASLRMDTRSLLVGAAAGVLAAGAGLAVVHTYRRHTAAAAAELDLLRELAGHGLGQGRSPGGGAAPLQQAAHSLDDEVVAEQLTRNVQFFTATGQQRVMGAFVVVVGLGVRTPSNLLSPRALALPAAQCFRSSLLLGQRAAGRGQPCGAHAPALGRRPAATHRL